MNNAALAGKWDLAAVYRKYGTFIIFAIIFLLASFFTRNFFSQANLTNVVRQMVVVTLLALGVTFVIILGHIDVSLGSVMALAGCISAEVMRTTQSLWLAVFAGLAVGVVVGLINGYTITYFTIPAFIMTLAMTTVARGSVLLFTGGKPITRLGSFSVIGQGRVAGIPIVFVILAFFLVLSWFLLNHTRFGRYIYAVGGNRSASIASGINADGVVRKAFLFNGILTAIAGIVLMSRMNSGQPAAGIGYEFDAITAVVVGGTSLAGGNGTILGTFIGSMIIAVINNNLNLLNVNSYWQQIVKGIIILIAVIIDVRTKRAAK
ncbi:MAG: ABC transporter permease [Planctomycetes bacterium]|nr:ABC transporter permease [Planctomycetota bacterium]MCD7897626.1 ABC transporter permease [Planctomycetaceae bacterium]